MYDVITIGSATVDMFMKSKSFHLQPTDDGILLCQEYGGKLDIDQFEAQSGGAGTNTAVGFKRLGFHTAAVVEIGKDIFGQMIWDDLKREQVDTSFIVSEKSENTAVSVLLISVDGGRSALTHRGASSMLEARDLPWQSLQETRWIHLSNVSGNLELLLRLFDHVHHSLGGLSWNPGHKELELLVTQKLVIESIVCDILLMNKEEWELLQAVQQRIIQHVPYIVITDGTHGGQVLIKGQYPLQYEIEKVATVQETGAGDAFAVGYIGGHLLSLSPMECVSWGKRNAQSVVQHMGAKTGLLTKSQMLSFNREVPTV